MTDDRWLRIKQLFEAAVERPLSERSSFVSAAVAGDETLRRHVEALLAADRAGAPLSEQWPVASESLLVELRNASATLRLGGSSLPGLIAGHRVGNYDVIAPLGAGGMGEVYRAHDARLGRDVAIKILPHAFTTDPERLARFEREARVLAALNHPHIAGIYGLEQTGTAPALVLELVEGPTLADRVNAGRIGVEEALTIGRQIADALVAAHDKGIVHRDLKPANVKVTPSGVVKVLDFGLAKPDVEGTIPEFVNSPTITVSGTRDGMIMGTAAYMSPEQARGKSVDKRSDIWSFGCVLYETLTGHKAFDRETVSDTIAAILEREPNWRLLPGATPTSVRRLLRRCLEKDVSRRLRDIGDACLELDDAIGRFGNRSLPRRLFDFGWDQRLAAVAVTTDGAPNWNPVWAPDGRHLYFVSGRGGPINLWRVPIDETSGKTAGPPEAVTTPAPFVAHITISADGTRIAYSSILRARNIQKLRIDPTTGTPRGEPAWITTGSPLWANPDPSPDGKWVVFYSSVQPEGDLYIARTDGTGLRQLTSGAEPIDRMPRWSPDGRWIAFHSRQGSVLVEDSPRWQRTPAVESAG
jgi:Protein kinase domain/WD40-like Beta Propeller Repeat